MVLPRFKYLRTTPGSGLVPRKLLSTRFILTLCFAFITGTTIGFNLRDMLLRTYTSVHCEHSQAIISSQIIGSMKAPPPKFTKLSDKFLLNIPPRKPCSSFMSKPWKYLDRLNNTEQQRYFMTFLVKSASHLIGRRFLIRQTWGSIQEVNGHKFGVIFVIGNVNDPQEQDLISQENNLFGDILQSDAKDDYFSLPLKVLGALQWVNYELGNKSDFFVSTDDDCYINVRATFDYFVTQKEKNIKLLHCGFVYDDSALPVREERSKYKVSRDVYPDEAYPTFCHGGMSVMSYKFISDIYRTAEVTDFGGFHLEDVLITGILRHKTYNTSQSIVPVDYHRMTLYNDRPERLVFHLGLVRKLQVSFAVRWRRTKAGMKMNSALLDKGPKDPSAEYFTAISISPPVLPGKHLNETMSIFSRLWRSFRSGQGISFVDPNLPVNIRIRPRRYPTNPEAPRLDAEERGSINSSENKGIRISVKVS